MSDRYTVISADCHGGGNIGDYRRYLASQWHEDFDAWEQSFVNPYSDLAGDDGARNWDSARRLNDLEDDGIIAEVIYPNTIPPFYPSSSLTYQPPAADSGNLARRWAGLQAHNRWLADFCADAPGRRAGIAQILLHDIDAAVAEIHWARAAGLTGGVLLPGVPPGSAVPQLFSSYYEPIWAACEETGMPVNHHGGSANPPMDGTPEGTVTFLLEVTWFSHRALTHLIVGGALERHPNLQLVFTEQGTAWVPGELERLDYFFHRMRTAVGSQEHIWGAPVVDKLSLTPSEYWARQCHVAASFMRRSEMPARHTVGVDRIMWGSDYPHREASFPWTTEALRQAYGGFDRAEVEMMLSGNAAALYGFDLDTLAAVAARVGPLVDEVAVPLEPGQVPIEAERCPAFVGYGAR